MNRLQTVALYVLIAFFALACFGAFSKGDHAAALVIGLVILILIPFTSDYIPGVSRLSDGRRALLAVVVFLAVSAFMGHRDIKTARDAFPHIKHQVVSEMQAALDAKNYKRAQDLAAEYLPVGDADVQRIYDTAKSKLKTEKDKVKTGIAK